MSEAAWAELGYEREFLDRVAALESDDTDSWMCDPPASSDGTLIQGWATDVNTSGSRVFAMGSMGYTIPHPPLDDWRAAGRRVVAASLYYFYGAWRASFEWHYGEHYDRAQARGNLPWIDMYSFGLPIALSLGDWAAADKLLEWPGPDLPFDEGLDDLTEEDNAYQIWLASRLRGEPATACEAQLGAVLRGRRKRPKLAQAAAQALLDRDPTAFTQALTAQLRHHRQRELDPKQLDCAFCLEATALWHLARRQDLKAQEPPHELMILIARP
ncbi:MAG: hypothetical protein P4L84_22260 [Isosphaeraceae bacterium]|nr:hypothetical protein [Isosphaeraceae bacterium]